MRPFTQKKQKAQLIAGSHFMSIRLLIENNLLRNRCSGRDFAQNQKQAFSIKENILQA